jgi:GTP-binding protein Era
VAEAIREQGEGLPVVMALNKVDLLPPPESPHAEAYLALLQPAAWLPVSATRGDNRDQLLDLVITHLPPGPRYYPEDQVTDQQTRFIAAELIREAALHHLHQEVPHALTVVVEEFKRRSENMTYIGATIFVERDSHKGIVIGKGGRTLKDLGQAARVQIEELLGTRVFLELWVKARPKWRKKEDELRRLGYVVPKR